MVGYGGGGAGGVVGGRDLGWSSRLKEAKKEKKSPSFPFEELLPLKQSVYRTGGGRGRGEGKGGGATDTALSSAAETSAWRLLPAGTS